MIISICLRFRKSGGLNTRVTLQRTASYAFRFRARLMLLRHPHTFVRLVGSSGLEPPTSRLSGARSNQLSYEPIQFSVFSCSSSPVLSSLHCFGGDDGIRTHDPLLAGQVLSQLSYTP